MENNMDKVEIALFPDGGGVVTVYVQKEDAEFFLELIVNGKTTIKDCAIRKGR